MPICHQTPEVPPARLDETCPSACGKSCPNSAASEVRGNCPEWDEIQMIQLSLHIPVPSPYPSVLGPGFPEKGGFPPVLIFVRSQMNRAFACTPGRSFGFLDAQSVTEQSNIPTMESCVGLCRNHHKNQPLNMGILRPKNTIYTGNTTRPQSFKSHMSIIALVVLFRRKVRSVP